MKKIIILCPGNNVTGGPELLHQLAHQLNDNNVDASIMYYPFDKKFKIPDVYQKYNVNVVDFDEKLARNSVVIVPEVCTGYVNKFKGSRVFIWWLSVDNYFNSVKSYDNSFKGFIKKIIYHRTLPLLLSDLKKYEHLTQSEYAKLFLENKDIKSSMLSDYLAEEHFIARDNMQKKDIICYNPKKGVLTTNYIIDNTDYEFVPIINMKPYEVSQLLQSAKIYMDFGEHPGKDRIPREAAMANCIVITGVKGSAGNLVDIEVSNRYKISEDMSNFIDVFKGLVDDVFNDFDKNLKEFSFYREKIKNEKNNFIQDVKKFVEYIK